MLNVQRKIAPLPERHNCRITGKTKATTMGRQWVNTKLSERITNNATFAAGGQCIRRADRRRRSMCDMQNISLKNAVGQRVRKAKNSAGGATDAIFFGRSVAINYSCSLALRRWRYSTSRFNAAVTNCPVLSPGIFTASTLSITSCGTLAATVCDFAFTAFVAMWCTPQKKQMQYAGKKIGVQHLTCSTPVIKLVFNTLLVQGAETTKPRKCRYHSQGF